MWKVIHFSKGFNSRRIPTWQNMWVKSVECFPEKSAWRCFSVFMNFSKRWTSQIPFSLILYALKEQVTVSGRMNSFRGVLQQMDVDWSNGGNPSSWWKRPDVADGESDKATHIFYFIHIKAAWDSNFTTSNFATIKMKLKGSTVFTKCEDWSRANLQGVALIHTSKETPALMGLSMKWKDLRY